jgi:hypothetical protein
LNPLQVNAPLGAQTPGWWHLSLRIKEIEDRLPSPFFGRIDQGIGDLDDLVASVPYADAHACVSQHGNIVEPIAHGCNLFAGYVVANA